MVRKKKNNMGVQESLDFIIEKMATKTDIEEIKETLGGHTQVLAEHSKTLAEHTGQLNTIQSDLNTMRDKRMQLEVRVGHMEKHLRIKPPTGTLS